MSKRLLVALAASLLFSVTGFAQNDAGEVAFANSGAGVAQVPFLHGLALLHDFEYPSAAAAFREAQTADPSFVMAYWGEAMTYTHPVWFQQNAVAARAVLTRLAPTERERAARAKSARERDYLHAVEVLYGSGTKNARDVLYADAMAELHSKYPDDVDATAFYALSLLGTAHEGRDEAVYMRAAALLEEVLPTHPRHPGVLHYLIHCYDDPVHAPLGMRAARIYGSVAPNAGHALHMTSHIFIAMGMWDEVVLANRRAIYVVNRQRKARSLPAVVCGHYPIWLHYALLQKGTFDDASQALEDCRASATAFPFNGAGEMDTQSGRFESFAEMRAHQIASGGPLAGGAPIPAGDAFDDARFLMAYGDLLAAARRADRDALSASLDSMRTLHERSLAAASHAMPMAADETGRARTRQEIMIRQGEALAAAAAGHHDEAIDILRAASVAEQAMPYEFGPPAIPKPSPELLADELLASGKGREAEAAYRVALARTPGRSVTLDGLARATKAVPPATATMP